MRLLIARKSNFIPDGLAKAPYQPTNSWKTAFVCLLAGYRFTIVDVHILKRVTDPDDKELGGCEILRSTRGREVQGSV